jgi:two-component system, NtrC family, sensor histidine kinase HydH
MYPGDWLRLATIALLLIVAALGVVGGAGSPLARRLALLAIDVAGINVASVANHLLGAPLGSLADAVFTAMAPPLALHFVVTFVGAGRTTKGLLLAAYSALAALAVASGVAFAREGTRAWIEGPMWSALFVGAAVPTLALTLALLVRHLRSADAGEKPRTRLLLAALALGGTLDTTDVVTSAARHTNYDAGAIGTLVSVGLVAMVVFRLRLFDRDLSASTALYAGTMGTVLVSMYLVVFWTLSERAAALVLATSCVTVVAGLTVREWMESTARIRGQRDRMTVLGRFAAQMAHDVRNPLAAIVGAARLAEDGAVDAEQRRFLGIVVGQAARIGEIVDKYDRLARVEAVRVPTNVADVVQRAASAQALAAPAVRFSLDIDAYDGTRAPVDEGLIASAVENLVRNAVEAMPGGGSIVLRVARRGDQVIVRVEDEGEGMDPRRAARAFEDFFTTKASGSGLGLAFVRRVAQAHGGTVALTTRTGKGTAVELRLPAAMKPLARRADRSRGGA